MAPDMLVSSFRLVIARIGAGLHALSLWAVPVFVAHQGAFLPIVVMTSIAVGVELLEKSAGICGACSGRGHID